MRLLTCLAWIAALAAPAAAQYRGQGLTIHEWGTFTTVIDVDGTPLPWYRPIVTDPLPTFVHHAARMKDGYRGTVRMETPVIYFHTNRPLRADVRVDFPAGSFTDWYPRSTEMSDQTLVWRSVQVDPSASALLPTELAGAHYYAARGVACAPLSITVGDATEHEKFLFYRGVGDFPLPLTFRLERNEVRVENASPHRVDHVLLFERREGACALALHSGIDPGQSHAFDRAALTFSPELRLDALKQVLRDQGLFEDEAQAMVDTWRHTWFEEGLRVLYTVPRQRTDEILPLSLAPTPSALERVLVGRAELVTPEARAEVLDLAHRLASDTHDRAALQQRATTRWGQIGLAILERDHIARLEAGDPDHATLMQAIVAWQTAMPR